jgi:hypothetical protein
MTFHAFARRGLTFAALSLALLIGVDRLIDARLPSETALKYRAVFGTDAGYSHLVLGASSEAYGINPRYLGREPYYNFAYSNAGPEFLLDWYQQFRARRPKPSVVLLGVSRATLRQSLTRRIEHDAGFMPFGVAASLWMRPETHLVESLANGVAFLREKPVLEAWLTGQHSPYEVEVAKYERGFAPLRVAPFRAGALVSHPRWPGREATFRRLLQAIAHDGARIVLVQPPCYLPEYGHSADEEALIRAIAREFRLPYMNYNDERRSPLNEDQTAFADASHLNERGSHAFSARLAMDLQAARTAPIPENRAGL